MSMAHANSRMVLPPLVVVILLSRYLTTAPSSRSTTKGDRPRIPHIYFEAKV